jgi:WD40 repeat protein
LQVENSIEFDGVLIRAIDVMGPTALVGMRDGTIYNVDLASGNKQAIMESHSDGEVWGLSIPNDDLVLTTADDNQIKVWSTKQRKCIQRGAVSSSARSLKRRGASSLTTFPDS